MCGSHFWGLEVHDQVAGVVSGEASPASQDLRASREAQLDYDGRSRGASDGQHAGPVWTDPLPSLPCYFLGPSLQNLRAVELGGRRPRRPQVACRQLGEAGDPELGMWFCFCGAGGGMGENARPRPGGSASGLRPITRVPSVSPSAA